MEVFEEGFCNSAVASCVISDGHTNSFIKFLSCNKIKDRVCATLNCHRLLSNLTNIDVEARLKYLLKLSILDLFQYRISQAHLIEEHGFFE